MADTSPIWNAFNSGELSPLLDGRTDQEKYFSGCKVLQNFIPTVQGPAQRRGGTRYLGGIKSNARAWLVTFEFSADQSYVLEFGDNYIRFWVNRGQLLNAGSPYEVATPWTSADLVTDEGTFGLRTVQSADVMWICSQRGDKAVYKLSRLGATNWTLALVPFTYGPFQDVNPASAIIVQSSALLGGVTLTATGALFRTQDVGTSFYLEDLDYLSRPTWEAGKTTAVGAVYRYEGSVYEAVAVGTTGKTGTFPPTHLEGRATDGIDAVTWLYRHSGYGIVRINGYTSSTVVTGTVVGRLPEGAASGGSNRWARAAFNDVDGWPVAVTFFRERLVYAKTRSVFISVVGDYDNFSRKDGPDVTKETGLILALTSDRVDLLRWIIGSRALLAGSSRSELSVQEQTTQQVFAADNATSIPQTEYGSRLLEPLRVGSNVLFVQRSGRKLREMKYDGSQDAYVADELTVLSEQILDAGVIDMDFQQEPDSLVWCVLADGSLAALTYNRERGVIAWGRHYVGGPGLFYQPDGTAAGFAIVESVASISAPDGRRDDVWLIVNRTINGSTKRYMEVIEDNRLAEVSGLASSFYLDGGISRPGGAPTTSISGLGHLEGATVQVLADGNPTRDYVVSSGTITLDDAASIVHVGFHAPCRLKTMRAEAQVPGGTAQTQMKSFAEVWFRLLSSLGGAAGPSFDRTDDFKFSNPVATVGSSLSLFSGDIQLAWPAGYDTDGYVCIVQNQPLPMTIAAIVGRLDISENK